MNNSRRKRINQSILILKGAQDRMQNALAEERKALSWLPDDNDNAEKRESVEEIISNLEDAIDNLNSAIETLEDADL